MHRLFLFLLATVCGPVLAQPDAPLRLAPFSAATGTQAPAPWRVVGVPGGKIPLTRFAVGDVDGNKAVRIAADKSYANLVHDLPGAVVPDTTRLRWRWRLDSGLAAADLRTRKGDDSPLKVCALFDMPLDKLGLWDRNLLRIARASSAEKLPSATLCYVWDTQLTADTVLPNAYTGRVRYLVVAGAEQPLGQWHAVSRNLAADMRRAFGAEADTMPPLMAVLVGADADNTGGSSLGFVGDVQLEP
jgi:hypothetical protein